MGRPASGPIRWRRAIAKAGVAAILAVSLVTISRMVTSTSQHDTAPQKLPAAAQQQPLTPTNLQKVEEALGPFSVIPPAVSNQPDTRFPAVLLLKQNGETAASKVWTVPYSQTSWSKQSAFQISRLTVQDGIAMLETDLGRNFAVRTDQPFILEENPEQVCLIQPDGSQWQVSTATAIFTRQPLTTN